MIFTPSADIDENESLTKAGCNKGEHFTDSFKAMQNASYPTAVRKAVKEKEESSSGAKVLVYVLALMTKMFYIQQMLLLKAKMGQPQRLGRQSSSCIVDVKFNHKQNLIRRM